MKWIGQHIYDLVARFRNDVYLEDISTGTIASGGNLGLDSNNKIVKAAEVGSSVDLTSEVTGTLPAGNGGTGVTSITALKNLLDDETWTFANNITGTLATAAQTNITSLGTLTALTVDDITLNAKSILILGDTDDTFNIATGAAGATTLTTTDNAGTDGHFEVAADGNIILDAAGDIALECGGGDLTCDADTITFSSANADDPQFIIKNTTADNQGARLQLRKDRGAAMVDNDRIGEIDFFGEDASQNSQQYAKVVVQAVETDHGSETGKIQFQVAEFDGNVRTGLLITGKDADSRIDVDVASGTDSVTTIAGDLAVTTGLILDSVDVTAIQTASEIASSFGDNDTSLLTAAAIDDRIRVVSKHVLRCNAFYINDNPMPQNSLYFGNNVGNNPYNWNDPAAVGGAISSTSSFTIIGDDENWGIVLPMDISKIEVQCSLRPSLGTDDDFSLAIYTGVRSSNSNADLTLTKIAHQSVSFNSGNQRYKQNDLTYTGDLDKGTMIYVGVGSEDATDAKNARGYMNITVTER